MSRSGNDPEVVDVLDAFDRAELCRYDAVHLVDERVIDPDRIHMDDEMDLKNFLDHSFDVIDHVVALHQIAVSINFYMGRSEDLPGSVIVDHQIMDTEDTRLSSDYFQDLIDHFFIGNFSQQSAGSFSYQLYAGPDDEQGYETSHITIDIEAGHLAYNKADKYGCRRDDIVPAVSGSSHKS